LIGVVAIYDNDDDTDDDADDDNTPPVEI